MVQLTEEEEEGWEKHEDSWLVKPLPLLLVSPRGVKLKTYQKVNVPHAILFPLLATSLLYIPSFFINPHLVLVFPSLVAPQWEIINSKDINLTSMIWSLWKYSHKFDDIVTTLRPIDVFSIDHFSLGLYLILGIFEVTSTLNISFHFNI